METSQVAPISGTPIFRPAALRDLASIAELEKLEFGELSYKYFALRQWFDLHGSDWVVAELAGVVCGYVMVAQRTGYHGAGSPNHAWVLGIAVAANCRGRGYGRILLEHAVSRCRSAMADQVYITVRPTDYPATNLYQTSGFVTTRYEPHYFGTGEPRRVLVRYLEPHPDIHALTDPTSEIWVKHHAGPG